MLQLLHNWKNLQGLEYMIHTHTTVEVNVCYDINEIISVTVFHHCLLYSLVVTFQQSDTTSYTFYKNTHSLFVHS